MCMRGNFWWTIQFFYSVYSGLDRKENECPQEAYSWGCNQHLGPQRNCHAWSTQIIWSVRRNNTTPCNLFLLWRNDVDGVKREAYSIFWRQLLHEYFNGSSTFVPRVGPGIVESTMRTLAQIISHQYVLTGIFPVQINKAFVLAMLCGR